MKFSAPHSLVALAWIAFAAIMTPSLSAAEPPSDKEVVILVEGVIPQIATGGGAYYMDFQFVNAGNSAASVTLAFFDSDGVPMSVPYIQDGLPTTATTLVETIAPRGIEFARTVVGAAQVQVGYAEVYSNPSYQVSVQTTFNQVVANRPLFQAFIPQDNLSKSVFFLPSINDGGQTSSLAVVSKAAQNVTYIARNPNGVEICSAGRPFLAGEHRAFIIRDMLPCLANTHGIVEVRGANAEGRIYGVGITAQDSGAFVTQPPVPVPQPLLF